MNHNDDKTLKAVTLPLAMLFIERAMHFLPKGDVDAMTAGAKQVIDMGYNISVALGVPLEAVKRATEIHIVKMTVNAMKEIRTNKPPHADSLLELAEQVMRMLVTDDSVIDKYYNEDGNTSTSTSKKPSRSDLSDLTVDALLKSIDKKNGSN